MRGLILAATGLFIFGQILWGPILIRPDEAIYTQTALEMRHRQDWTVPVYEGKPSFIKPPVLYWGELAGMSVFGDRIWAARLFVWLLGIFTVGMTYRIGVEFFSPEGGLCAAALLFCNVFFFQYSQADMTDLPLVFFVILSFYFFLHGSGRNANWLWAAGAAVGFSILAKGPLGIVLCLIPILIYTAAYRGLAMLKSKVFWEGTAIAVFCASLWPAVLLASGYGPGFYRQFILGENFGKFAGPWMPTHILLIGILGGMVPWTFLFLESMAGGIAGALSGKKDRKTLFLVLWIGSIFAIFCFPARKLPHYLLPSLPACALLMSATSRFSRSSILATRLLIASIGILWMFGARLSHDHLVQAVIIAGGGLAVASSLRLKDRSSLAASAILFGFLLSTIPFVLPAVEQPMQRRESERLSGNVGVFCPDDRDQRGFEISPLFASVETGEEAGSFLSAGGTLIVPARERSLIRAGPLEIVREWRVWKGGIGLGEVIRAVWTGDTSPLEEEMLALKKG